MYSKLRNLINAKEVSVHFVLKLAMEFQIFNKFRISWTGSASHVLVFVSALVVYVRIILHK